MYRCWVRSFSSMVKELASLINEHARLSNIWEAVYEEGSNVAEWFRAQDLKSWRPWFKPSILLLSGFVLGSPEFNSSTVLCI